jgi:hypothetical protein
MRSPTVVVRGVGTYYALEVSSAGHEHRLRTKNTTNCVLEAESLVTKWAPVDGPPVSRRDLLKRSALSGALIWAVPVIESIRPTPAFAQMSPPAGCIILSPASDDKNFQQGQNYCPTPGPTCCGGSFGNAGQVDRFTFFNPAPNCTQIVVRTIALDCNASDTTPERNPDVGQFAVVIESTTGAGCGACAVHDAVLVSASGRTIIQSLNNGPVNCFGQGVDASIPCSNPNIGPSTRLAVRLVCAGC